MNNFRSVDFWKAAIMTLPDTAFFELLRTVFGKIKTPFNKQMLMGDLEKFLLRKEIQETIACYINDSDIRVIVAVAALNEPAPGELETFFSGELSYAELYDLIINLEERFILYRFSEKEQNKTVSRIALNPVLEPVLSPHIADKSFLFPSVPVDKTPEDTAPQDKSQFFPDDRIFAALLSFVSQNKWFFRTAGGSIRQKVLNAAKPMFFDLPLETIIGGLQVLGLFFAEEEKLFPDYQRFAAFGNLDRQDRLIYCSAGIWCYFDFLEDVLSKSTAHQSAARQSAARETEPVSLSSWLFRSRSRTYAEIISRLYNALEPDRLYPQTTLQRLAYMLEHNNIDNTGGKIVNKIIDIMEKTGLIVRVSQTDGLQTAGSGTDGLIAEWRKMASTKSSEPAIAMDTPFTLLMYPGIAYNDAITIAAFSDVVEAGMTVRFELSRDSVVTAFNRGISADTIIELLNRLSHNRVDENLLFTLRDWEKRYKEVTLRRGLVLTLAPEQQHLADTRTLGRLITETLAPGVYLLPESAEEKAVDSLHKAGVTIIARRKNDGGDDIYNDTESFGGSLRHFFQPLSSALSAQQTAPLSTDKPHADKKSRASQTNAATAATAEVAAATAATAASTLMEQFHSILAQTSHAKEERDELAARIDRRLVLSESQLKDAAVRYEKLEARGLDYVGKAMIAKQAISMQSPIEVIWPGKQKQQERVFGIPKALEKADNESILIIDLLDNENTLRLSLGKISVLRRIKKSIFEV